jgi:hypothetical protein
MPALPVIKILDVLKDTLTHGRHRVPTLLKHADKLARESASKLVELKSHE